MGAYSRYEVVVSSTLAIVALRLAVRHDQAPMVQASSTLHHSVMTFTLAKAVVSSFKSIVYLGNDGLPRRSPNSGPVR